MDEQKQPRPLDNSEHDKLTVTWGVEEAAAYLRAHPDTVRKLAQDRRIPGAKIGKSWVFMPHLLAEYLEQQCRSQVRRGDPMLSPGQQLAAELRAAREERIANRTPEEQARIDRRIFNREARDQ